MKNHTLALCLFAAAGSACAQAEKPAGTQPASEQVIVPEVARREVPLPRIPSRDFFGGLYAGSYATQNFGSSAVVGFRLGYLITEDVFVEGSFGRSKVSDSAFRQVLPGGVFVNRSEALSYASVAAGYNVITGEAFFGKSRAKALQGYLLAGIGSTRLAEQRHQTITLGAGLRLVANDRFLLQADVREHLFSLDLLGQRQSTRNPEITAGLTVTF